MTTSIVPSDKMDAALIESVLLSGDLSKLSPQQRVSYYKNVCESIGLNPLTKPFDYIQLNGKLTLYAKKDTTDQLRSIHKISIPSIEKQRDGDLYIVTAHAITPDGRQDTATGVVSLGNLKGDILANAIMKAETKAKRRVTLSICGLGWLDETEVQSIPDARPVSVVPDTGEIVTGTIENINQDTGGTTEPVEIIEVMGEWAVRYAAERWGCKPSEAAPKLAQMKLGKTVNKKDFIEIVNDAK